MLAAILTNLATGFGGHLWPEHEGSKDSGISRQRETLRGQIRALLDDEKTAAEVREVVRPFTRQAPQAPERPLEQRIDFEALSRDLNAIERLSSILPRSEPLEETLVLLLLLEV